MRQQRANARGLNGFNDDLVGGFVGIGRDLAGGDHLHTLFGLDAQALEHALPHHRVDLGALILEREINMTRGMRAAPARHFAAHPHIAEAILDRALESARQFRDAEFGRVAGGF